MALVQQKDKWARVLMGIAVLIVFAGLVSYYVIARYQAVVVEKRNKATVLARHLETHIDSRLTALELLAGDPEIREANPAKVTDELERAVNMLGFSNVVIFDRNGQFLAQAVPKATIHTVHDKNSFQSALSGKPTVSGRIIYDGLDSAYVSLRVPIKSSQGTVKAVLTAGLPLNEISRIINEREEHSESDYSFVIDAKFRVLYHPRFTDIYNKENSFDRYQDLFQNTNKEFIGVSEWDRTEKLYVFDEIGGTGWRVVVATPVSGIYSAIVKSSLFDIGIFLLLVITIGLLYYIISQSKRHELEMENLKFERLSCASQLAAGIAHEIRNPLTSIKGFIQLIMRRIDQPPPKSYLHIIYGEIERIEKLIYEFQMLARPLKPAQFCEIDMAKTVNDVMLLMEAQALAKKASLILNCRANSRFQVKGDEAQLKQVLINLVRNAIEAVDTEGRIILSVSIKERMVSITVSDNGTGIPQEVLVKLGTPFFTTKESGTGLGLSVCYSIVQNHNGRIEVNSKVGEGTSFTVLLPHVG